MSYLDEPERGCCHDSRKPVFYRPPLPEVIRHMEWGWIVVPMLAAACLAMTVTGLLLGRYHIEMTILGGQLLFLVLAVPLFFWENLRDRLIRLRTDPFCIHCGWTLAGLPEEGRCPECGEPYRLNVVEMFRQDPQWVIAYWKFAGKAPTVELFNSRHVATHSPSPSGRGLG